MTSYALEEIARERCASRIRCGLASARAMHRRPRRTSFRSSVARMLVAVGITVADLGRSLAGSEA
jgi:hypothetical protein